MTEMIRFRHEVKHFINRSDMLAIRGRLRHVMSADSHAKDGIYHIRSLYFDTPGDKALREKLDGVNMREKFRIRYYNGDISLIHLEKKSKHNALGTKYSASLTYEEAGRITRGEIDWMPHHENPLIKELYVKMRCQGLMPKTIVDYTREPYIYAPGNVRVTFDSQIRTGLHCTDFLNPDCATIPIGDHVIIMEVKWDDFLPSIIRDLIQEPGRSASAFSKYAACRIFD